MPRLPALCLAALLAFAGRADAAAPGHELKDPFARADGPPILPPERTTGAYGPPVLTPERTSASLSDLRDPFTRAADGPPVLAPARASDLRDPFTRAANDPPVPPGQTAAALSDLHDPFTARQDRRPRAHPREVQPDLRNPFITAPRGRRIPAAAEPIPGSSGAELTPRSSAPDLKNPFPRAPTRPAARARAATDVEPTSSDLKNPFVRRDPPTRPRSPAVTTPLRPLRTPADQRLGAPLQRPRRVDPAR